ncbi:ribosome maturation factor RimP [Eubacterium oxidoreducens]|uniref:Ribosome maturation factor RimP n=1 Tax=Eubacterium oxidoreducens TaxID=1732 RepID=A0A1G6ANT3_EUBOX|nr:ribosome maturation factor RimP [Eubacterium oxidoreducens]SDB10019.1 ribosome maturation factor RimP [Eubacterium oxidoreducens]
MSQREQYEQKTEEYILPILEEYGFELYDIEYVKEGADYYLRIYIDKEGGITINDCEVVSRKMNEILDREDYIKEQYIFEVSSPGLGRVLKKNRHFEKSIGEEIEIKLYKALNHSKEFTGILRSYDKDTITIEINENETMTFAKKEVALARLALDF